MNSLLEVSVLCVVLFMPGKAEVAAFVRQYPSFSNREWQVIKAKIFNAINHNRNHLCM